MTYKLIALELVEAPLLLPNAKEEAQFKQPGAELGTAIGKCNKKFHTPLKTCLGRHP